MSKDISKAVFSLLEEADKLDKVADRYKGCSYYSVDGSVPGDYERRLAAILRLGATAMLEGSKNVA